MNEGGVNGFPNPVAYLRSLLGPDVVLIWVPKGEKLPVFKGWQNVRVDSMRKAGYIRNLNNDHNIAVLLGEPSGGICSIDIDHDADVEPFLALNPDLRNSLRSKGRRGCACWA